jgi:glycosyltransferase involved in cell wall biosynthesis
MSGRQKSAGGLLVRPVRLGVLFDQSLHAGGGYQQALNAALLVKKLSQDLAEPVFFTLHKGNVEVLKEFGIDSVYIQSGVWKKIELLLRTRVLSVDMRLLTTWQRLFPYNYFEKYIVQHGVDLMYFLSPSGMANSLEVTNYITTVWDLCHRDDLEFPEVRTNRIFESRERNYRSLLPKAVAVLVDSPLGKANVVRRYGIDVERVHVVPFSAATGVQDTGSMNVMEEVDIKKKYALDVPYVYYPAQFWSHKNHVYLLEGLRILEDKYGLQIGAIFSGGDKGNMPYVRAVVEKLGLSGRVRFAGFVSNEEVPRLYQQSLALVMPTYFGPTNLTPIEAFQLGIPVLYPDKIGLRDQVGDAALLMDLDDPSSMAKHLNDLLSIPEMREELVKKGEEQLKMFSDEGRINVLEGVLKNFQRRRACWQGYAALR